MRLRFRILRKVQLGEVPLRLQVDARKTGFTRGRAQKLGAETVSQ
jgi:hypothetical protein